MQTLRRALEAAEDEQARWWWWPFAVTGVLAALPYLFSRVLPMVDFPLHQLELGIWLDALAEGTRFGEFYEVGPYTLPYWGTSAIGAVFAQVLGIEAGARAVVALYAFGAPLAAAALCRASGRSPWWGLLLTPFTYDFNLSWGFLAYCFAGMLLLWTLAHAVRAESDEQGGGRDAWFAVLIALFLGWTHPQIAAVCSGLCLYFGVFAPSTRARLVWLRVGLCSFAAPLVWLLSAKGEAATNFAGVIEYEALPVLIERLATYSVDTLPGWLEEALLLATLPALAWAWRTYGARPQWGDIKLLSIPLVCLLMYFITPFNMSGQAVCQRMPFVALLFMPLLAPPGRLRPALKVALLAGALLGTANTGLAISGFSAEASPALDAAIDAAPEGARTLYVAYDPWSAWVKAPGYSHVGALLTLRRGGVYATNFDRLTIRYRPGVDRKGTIMGHEIAIYSRFAKTGKIPLLSPAQVPSWDLHLVRAPLAAPLSPISGVPPAEQVVAFVPPFTLSRPPAAAKQ